MKAITKITTVLLILYTFNSYSQDWQWVKHIGSGGTPPKGQDATNTIITDKNGNSYFAGSFDGSACYFETDTLSLSGSIDFFLAKYDNTGNELWIKQFVGGFGTSGGSGGICYDSINGYIYLTGSKRGMINFGGIFLNSGQMSFFLAKFDLNGNCIWAKQANSSAESGGAGITIDNNGDVYVCGSNMDSASFDAYTIPRGGFIAKYNASGNCLWAKNKFRYKNSFVASELNSQDINIVDTTILISGHVLNDTIIVDTITVFNNGNNAAYLSAFDLDGNIRWLKLAGGGSNSIGGWDFSVDENGNSYICGRFTVTGYFDTIVLTNPMNNDAFIAKYNILGELQWVKQLSASGGSGAWNINTTSDGTSYVTGYFNGTANFGSYSVTSSTFQDMFVARYDSNGVCLGVRNFGKAEGTAISVNNNHEFWVAGKLFGSTTIDGVPYSYYGDPSDLFVAKGDAPIGIETYNERKTVNTLHIYANPNKGTCNITIPDELLNEQNLVLTIYDVSGKIIQQQQVQIEQEKIKINLEAEAKGIYNVTLGNAKKMYNGKIVFE